MGNVSPYPAALWVALDVSGQLQPALEIPHSEGNIYGSALGDFSFHLAFLRRGVQISADPVKMMKIHRTLQLSSGLKSACLTLCRISSPISCSVGGRELVLNYLQAGDNNQPPCTVYISEEGWS